MLRAALLATGLLGLVLIAACGGEDEPRVDLTPAADSIEPYPGARLHSEGVPPSGVNEWKREDFAYDRLYSVSSVQEVTQDEILSYFQTGLPEQDWQLEEGTGGARVELFDEYCDGSLIKCARFIKDNVRAIISVPARISLNPSATGGNLYHVHVEVYSPS